MTVNRIFHYTIISLHLISKEIYMQTRSLGMQVKIVVHEDLQHSKERMYREITVTSRKIPRIPTECENPFNPFFVFESDP